MLWQNQVEGQTEARWMPHFKGIKVMGVAVGVAAALVWGCCAGLERGAQTEVAVLGILLMAVAVAMWSAGTYFQERTAEARGQTRLLEAISKALEGRVGPAGVEKPRSVG
jgi:hypothetical protein